MADVNPRLTSTNPQIVEASSHRCDGAARHATGEQMQEPKTILLVDDELDIRELYTLVLESAGYSVIAVSHAAAAKRLLPHTSCISRLNGHFCPTLRSKSLCEHRSVMAGNF
jgi:hypothetical protein